MCIGRRTAVFFVFVALLAACSNDSKPSANASSSSAVQSSGPASSAAEGPPAPACNRPHTAGLTTETFDFQGAARTYQLYVPQAYDGTHAVPVVFEFHGYGSNAAQQVVYGDFRPLADQDDFLIVAPDGQNAAGGRHFNLTGEPGLQNDIAMVGGLLDQIEAQFCVDTQRVFSTGMSDGGAMTSLLACVSADRFAAFGAVAVVVYPRQLCDKAKHPPILAFSGTADPIVPFEGGAVHCCGGMVLAAPSDAMNNWAAHDGCSPAPTEDRLGSEVRRRSWNGCVAGSDVAFYIIDGGGHTWPGSAIPAARLGLTTKQISASETIWDFFKAHPMAAAPR